MIPNQIVRGGVERLTQGGMGSLLAMTSTRTEGKKSETPMNELTKVRRERFAERGHQHASTVSYGNGKVDAPCCPANDRLEVH